MSSPPLEIHDLGGSGPTFAIVHGFTGSSQDFFEVAPRLTDVRRVVLIDQLGHGDSPRVGTYTYEVLTAAVTAAVEGFGGPVDLLGHSLGGRVVLPIATERPHLVRSLVLMDTWAEAPDLQALERYDAASPECEHRLIVAVRGDSWHEFLLDRNAARVDPAAVAQLAPLLVLDEWDVLEPSRSIRCPVTVLVGQFDTPFLEPSQRLVSAIPGARLIVIDGAYHSPQLSHPEAWERAIRHHLENVDADDG